MSCTNAFDRRYWLIGVGLICLLCLPQLARAQQDDDASSQKKKDSFVTTGSLGNVLAQKTPNGGTTHVFGNFGGFNALFLRGTYDGNPATFDEVGISAPLAVAFELVNQHAGFLTDLSITYGAANAIATNTPPGVDADQGQLDVWYQSDHYASIAARLGDHVLTSTTLTAYTSPNGVGQVFYDLAFAADYAGSGWAGKLIPMLKFAVPVGADVTGSYAQATTNPAVTVLSKTKYPITLSLPLTFGAGFDDYIYGPNSDTSVYGSAAPGYSIPLAFIPSSYGNWTWSSQVEVIVRDDDIASVPIPAVDSDNVVTLVQTYIKFAY